MNEKQSILLKLSLGYFLVFTGICISFQLRYDTSVKFIFLDEKSTILNSTLRIAGVSTF
jgi:hypothetical protein